MGSSAFDTSPNMLTHRKLASNISERISPCREIDFTITFPMQGPYHLYISTDCTLAHTSLG